MYYKNKKVEKSATLTSITVLKLACPNDQCHNTITTNLKCSPCCSLEDLSDSLLALGRALEVGEGIDLLGHGSSLLRFDRLLLHLPQLFDGIGIVAKILLRTSCHILIFNHQTYLFVSHEYDRDIRTEVLDLWGPLLWDVLQGVGGVYAEAHEDHVSVRIGERPQPVVVFLPSRVPQCKLDLGLVIVNNEKES